MNPYSFECCKLILRVVCWKSISPMPAGSKKKRWEVSSEKRRKVESPRVSRSKSEKDQSELPTSNFQIWTFNSQFRLIKKIILFNSKKWIRIHLNVESWYWELYIENPSTQCQQAVCWVRTTRRRSKVAKYVKCLPWTCWRLRGKMYNVYTAFSYRLAKSMFFNSELNLARNPELWTTSIIPFFSTFIPFYILT